MKFSLLLKITVYRFDLKKMVIPGNNEVSTFTLVHHSFLIKCWGLEIDRNRRHSFAGRHFELLKTKVNERHLARFCIATVYLWSNLGKGSFHVTDRYGTFLEKETFTYLKKIVGAKSYSIEKLVRRFAENTRITEITTEITENIILLGLYMVVSATLSLVQLI